MSVLDITLSNECPGYNTKQSDGEVPLSNECPGYNTKQSDGEVPGMPGIWGIRSTPSLPLFPGPLWPGVVAPDRTLSMGSIELTAYLC